MIFAKPSLLLSGRNKDRHDPARECPRHGPLAVARGGTPVGRLRHGPSAWVRVSPLGLEARARRGVPPHPGTLPGTARRRDRPDPSGNAALHGEELVARKPHRERTLRVVMRSPHLGAGRVCPAPASDSGRSQGRWGPDDRDPRDHDGSALSGVAAGRRRDIQAPLPGVGPEPRSAVQQLREFFRPPKGA